PVQKPVAEPLGRPPDPPDLHDIDPRPKDHAITPPLHSSSGSGAGPRRSPGPTRYGRPGTAAAPSPPGAPAAVPPPATRKSRCPRPPPPPCPGRPPSIPRRPAGPHPTSWPPSGGPSAFG